MTTPPEHIPVLVHEVVQGLLPRNNPSAAGIYVDATFGRGGYSRALLHAIPDCKVIGIDRDPAACAAGVEFEEKYGSRFRMIQGPFSALDRLLGDAGIDRVQAIAFDLGVSSPQLDTPERGFSFRHDGPLDMRMSAQGQTAADLVNRVPEQELADIIYRYGEEKASRRIARAIVARRRTQEFSRTADLAALVASVMPRRDETHPATRTFQALRIAVNNELDELEQGLHHAETLLDDGGRLAVVTFHSLEDRIVKHFLRQRSGKEARGSRHRPDLSVMPLATFRLEQSRAITPSADEEKRNPRARSAKLRIAVRQREEERHAA